MYGNYGYLVPISTTAYAATGLATSQRLDIRSGAGVEIAAQDKPVWAKLGGSTVAATAGTAGEMLVPAGEVLFIPRPGSPASDGLGPEFTHIAVIEDAVSAEASVTIYG